jgi:hypothetical protein
MATILPALPKASISKAAGLATHAQHLDFADIVSIDSSGTKPSYYLEGTEIDNFDNFE